jgi:hypothetical protein
MFSLQIYGRYLSLQLNSSSLLLCKLLLLQITHPRQLTAKVKEILIVFISGKLICSRVTNLTYIDTHRSYLTILPASSAHACV